MKKVLFLFAFMVLPCFSFLHKNSRTTQVHSPFRWVFADSAARVGESVTTSDTDKVAYQKSDSSLWVLRDNDPKTWIEMSNQTNHSTGSDSCEVQGFSDKDSILVKWAITYNVVSITIQFNWSGTSNSTLFNIVLPVKLRPSNSLAFKCNPKSFVNDGSVLDYNDDVNLFVMNTGVMEFVLNYNFSGYGNWTASGSKGFGSYGQQTFTYLLD